MSIEIQGLDEIFDKLTLFTDTKKVDAALGKACALIERSAREKAPKGKNGELRRSITSKAEFLEGIVFTPLEYAPYVEYGTGIHAEGGNGRKDVPWCYEDEKGEWHTTYGMEPQPYMRPALDENREEVLRLIRESILEDV